MDVVVEAIKEGSNERKLEKDNDDKQPQGGESNPKKNRKKDRKRTDEEADDVENKKSGRKFTKRVKNIEED
jgi:hypothetical protein